nr:ShlB/FhaC/HecB family hemolysin secretion/activation protein [Aquabacterium terrae]
MREAGRALGPIETFVFEGATVVGDADLQALARPYTQRPVTTADLEELRLAITRLLIERGFVTSGAVIPEGAWRDGRFRFVIVEGRLLAVRVQGQERLREGYVAERLVHGPNEVLNINLLQDRFQRLLEDPLIARLNARIVPGAALGEAALEVEVTRARPYKLALFANNHRPPSVGEGAGGVTGALWNLTGLGDVVDATALASRGSERTNVGWSVPLPLVGGSFGLRHDQGDASVIEEPVASIDIVSRVKSLDVSFTRAFFETLNDRLTLGLVWTQRENRTTLLGEPFSFTPGEPDGVSRLHAWRFSQDYTRRQPGQALALRSTFTWGRTNIDTSVDPAAPARRYAFWLGQAQFAQRLGVLPGAQLVLKATVQHSRDRLLPLERLAVGGVASVRGYRENQLVRDSGAIGTVELQMPVIGTAESEPRVILAPFIDAGSARNRGERTERIASAGVALDARFGGGWSVELQAAKKLKTPAVASHGALQDRGVHVQIRYEVF